MNEPMTEEEIAEARALLDADDVDPIEWAERAPRLIAEIARLRAEIDRLTNEDSRAAAAVEVYMERAESAERERDALRAALLHVAGLQIRRDADAVEVCAIRATANDLRAPFSDERVTARLVEMRAGTRDAAAARLAEVMRERDEARAALVRCRCTAEQGDSKCGAHPSCFGCGDLLTDANRAPLPLWCVRCHDQNTADPIDHEALAAADRADVQGGGLPASPFVTCTVCGFAPCDPSSPDHVGGRPPLDPAHVAALIGLLEHAEQRLEDADRPHKVDAARAEIAALKAVLGEEVKP